MKYHKLQKMKVGNLSRPVRALWIEIPVVIHELMKLDTSRPVRALWIEILMNSVTEEVIGVEAREGLVD